MADIPLPTDIGRVRHLTAQMHKSEDNAGDPIDEGFLLGADGARGHTWYDPAILGATTLDGLTDVTITTPVVGDRLRFDGTVWRNSALIWQPLTDPSVPDLIFDTGTGDIIMVEA